MLKWLSENLKAIEGSNMYIRELATLIAVADQGSFLKAAKELYITPACLMETLDIWTDVHPSLVTLPMEWEYKIPYGIVYAKSPSQAVHDFISVVQKSITV